MNPDRNKPDAKSQLPLGATVRFNLAQGHAVGTAVVRAAEFDDGWLYLLDVITGTDVEPHRNEQSELWAWDFEVSNP